MMKYTIFKTKWGYFGLGGTEKGISRSWLPMGDREKVKQKILKEYPGAEYDKGFFGEIQRQISAYFEGSCENFGRDVPVVLDGLRPFARRILAECRRVRYGQTISYGRLAEAAGKGSAARAVGGAMAQNPLPLIIPCHRVVCADGKIGGFSAMGGVKLKKRMLEIEEKAVLK